MRTPVVVLEYEARKLLPWTAGLGAQKNFDPQHPLARDSKGRSLALVLFLCLTQFVLCGLALRISHPPANPPTSLVMFYEFEKVKGAKCLREVH